MNNLGHTHLLSSNNTDNAECTEASCGSVGVPHGSGVKGGATNTTIKNFGEKKMIADTVRGIGGWETHKSIITGRAGKPLHTVHHDKSSTGDIKLGDGRSRFGYIYIPLDGAKPVHDPIDKYLSLPSHDKTKLRHRGHDPAHLNWHYGDHKLDTSIS